MVSCSTPAPGPLVQDGATTLAWTGFDGFGVRDEPGAPESFTFVATSATSS